MPRRSRRMARRKGPKRIPRAPQTLPQVDLNPVNSMHARYSGTVTITSNTEVVQSFNCGDLIAAAGCVATAVNQSYTVAQSARLKSVDVWVTYGQPSSGTTFSPPLPCTVGLVWYNTIGAASGRVQSTTSLSTATPTHVHGKPERQSLGSFWLSQQDAANSLFDIVYTSPVSSSFNYIVFVDVKFDWVASNQSFSPITKAPGTTSLTTGNMYYFPLDGPAGGYLRQGLPNAH